MTKRKLPLSVERVIEQFSKLPGIGPKSASRLAFYLLTKPEADIAALGTAISQIRAGLETCQICFNIAESDPCSICAAPDRKMDIILVVEEPLDVVALERAGWEGRYHVLGGVISPIAGIGPNELRVAELMNRLRNVNESISELVLGMDPSLEGEATALYLEREISKFREELPHLKTLRITRLARGLPVGSDLEYADELTLSRALEGRREY